jgi:restriction endonuclease S subunit
MKLKPYPKYKNSGIQWIGEIPEGWKQFRLKHVVNEFIAGGTPSSDNEKFWAQENEKGINWVAIADMTNTDFIEKTNKKITTAGLADKGLKILPKGTLLYSIFASLGKVSILKIDAVTNQAILGLIPGKKINNNFLKYYLLSLEDPIIALSNANTQNNLNSTIVKNIDMALPTELEEQTYIASFLDSQTSKIDKTIEKDRQLIKLLKEKRTALINHVVTKGLNPNARMKDSGIDWIGEIPEGWEVHKLKFKADINKRKLNDDTDPTFKINYLDISNVDSSGNIHDIEEQYFEDAPSRARRIPKEKDTIISTVRTYLKAVAYLEKIPKNFIVSTGFAVLEAHKETVPKYLYYSVRTEKFIQAVIAVSKGVAYPAINPPELGQLYLVIPPLSEQKSIVKYLDHQTSKIDKTIKKIEEHINLLEEYKKSLIHHVVTGKVDVREAVA